MAAEKIIVRVGEEKKQAILSVFRNTVMVVLSAFFFSLSFPGFFSEKGMPLMAFLFFIPLVPVLQKCSWTASVLYGWIHASVSYVLFNYWLADFHPLTIIIVPLIYVGYYSFLFPLLKAGVTLFPRSGFLWQALIWTGYEFVKSKGFLAYSYGTVGSAFYQWPVLVRSASLTGIWGLSFLAVVTGAWLGNAFDLKKVCKSLKEWCFYQRAGGGIAIYALVLVLYGTFSAVDYSDSPHFQIALTQHNADSWQGGYKAYKSNYLALRDLSLQSQEHKDPDLIVWPETAFVPSIYYHKTYKQNQLSLSLVEDLEDFLSTQEVPYLLGNDDARKELSKKSADLERVDYNALLLYDHGWQDLYRKKHLVPFTEHFPYEEEFPLVYQMLLDADTHFWKKGDAFSTIDVGKFKIGTPICFEDTFGYISRAFVNAGANIIVNVSNDAWSGSVVAERQHFMLSVFRAGENRRTMVRSTNSGITAWVDPNGVIQEELPPFILDVLVVDVPVYTNSRTLYTLWGDWFAWGCLIVALLGLLMGFLRRLTIQYRSRKIEKQVYDRGTV
ncbi:MAG: apolipoprotein N-acyltransferase [Spirochaetaceae bacterium 4572_59]|nr:MAG: apolipoprotein N-acyltransferase [Spirochaetaceae bacterium 4572_59]